MPDHERQTLLLPAMYWWVVLFYFSCEDGVKAVYSDELHPASKLARQWDQSKKQTWLSILWHLFKATLFLSSTEEFVKTCFSGWSLLKVQHDMGRVQQENSIGKVIHAKQPLLPRLTATAVELHQMGWKFPPWDQRHLFIRCLCQQRGSCAKGRHRRHLILLQCLSPVQAAFLYPPVSTVSAPLQGLANWANTSC